MTLMMRNRWRHEGPDHSRRLSPGSVPAEAVVESLFWRRLEIAKSQIRVCQDPNPGSVGEALKVERTQEIVDRYKFRTDIFLLCIDRDGEVSRRQVLDGIEERFRMPGVFLFFAEAAWEEIETWTLAGLELPSQWRWHDIREEVDVKETCFEPLVASRGLCDFARQGPQAARIGSCTSDRPDRAIVFGRLRCAGHTDGTRVRPTPVGHGLRVMSLWVFRSTPGTVFEQSTGGIQESDIHTGQAPSCPMGYSNAVGQANKASQ